MNSLKRVAWALTTTATAAGLALSAPTAHADINPTASSHVVALNDDLALVPASAGYNYIVNRHSGKCLTVDGNSSRNGAPVNQYSCVHKHNQQWRASTQNTGFQLQARHSGRCMSVKGGSKRKGAPVIQWNCNGALDQTFIGVRETLRPQHSRLCLAIKGGSTANRAPLIQWRCSGATDQNFKPRRA
ncbi:RICIN domain-containing protein [Streptomyces sp. NPDC058001]|uniref:RICIN domain-containing protein n=1 Tax=Streptomyces sp. NPDC058001 TaxID=3346300 RepID=UPI0036EBF380